MTAKTTPLAPCAYCRDCKRHGHADGHAVFVCRYCRSRNLMLTGGYGVAR